MKYLLVFLLLCFASSIQAEENGDWYMQLEFEAIDLIIRIRLDTLWQIAESVWIEESIPCSLYSNSQWLLGIYQSSLYGFKDRIRDIVNAPSITPNGFWAYTYPNFVASGDTFLVEMQDSVWMIGERPKTEILLIWHRWEPWGLWWYLRPEIKKEEK